MANLGAFSRDFSNAFTKTFSAVSAATEQRARTKLAQNADARAQRNADQADADRAAEEAYFSSQYGSVAAAAAPAGIPAPPNKLGGVTPTGEPVPVGPDYETQPEANEQYEAGLAKDRNFTPAPPAKTPAPKMAPPDELGGPTEQKGGLPAYKGRITARIAADLRAREETQYKRAQDERDFQETKRVNDANIATSQFALTQKQYDDAKLRAQDFSKQAFTVADSLAGADNLSVNDPKVASATAKIVDALEQGYAATPDGRSIKVNKTPAGYVVDTIEDKTGRVISQDTFKTVGELKAATMMFGQMTQGDKLGEWIGATSADAIGNKVRGTQAEAEVNAFRDAVMGATPEEKLSPGYAEKVLRGAKELEGKYGSIIMETIDEPVPNPNAGLEGEPEFLIDQRTGRPVTRKVQVNPLLKLAEFVQPNTTIKAADGSSADAQTVIQNVLANPAPALQRAGGNPQQMLTMLKDRLVQGGLDEGVASVLVQQAATQLPQALQQSMAAYATPQGIQTSNSGEAVQAATPQAARARALPAWQLRARDVPAEQVTASEPTGALPVRRPTAPVTVDPNARRIGSPFNR